MGQFNLNYNYYSGLSDKALTNDGEAIWDLVMVQAKLNAPNYGDGNFLFPIDFTTVIGRYLADNFDEGDAGYTDSKWHNVEGSTNIIDLLDKIQNGDTAKTKELFKMVDMDIKYNKEPLQVTPYYSFKEAIDQCRNIAERKAKEEAERKAKEEIKEEAERNSYKSLIEDFVSDIKECEYKDGIIFGKKKKIHYVANPITKRIWNAVVNKSSEADFDDNDFVPQKELGTFLENLNSYYSGKIVFEYLHKNIHALVHLQVYEKQDKNACFVYIKEEN